MDVNKVTRNQRQTDRQRDRETEEKTGRQTDTDRQTDRQTHTHTQTDRQTYDSDHPDHQVRVDTNPCDGRHKCHEIPASPASLSTVWNSEEHDGDQWPGHHPDEALTPARRYCPDPRSLRHIDRVWHSCTYKCHIHSFILNIGAGTIFRLGGGEKKLVKNKTIKFKI